MKKTKNGKRAKTKNGKKKNGKPHETTNSLTIFFYTSFICVLALFFT